MSLIHDPSGFEVTTSFEGSSAVLTLHGRVESLAAFDLWAALKAAVELHRESVVLDLSELEFIGAAGLVALANAEKSFAEAGVELTVRTPSRLVEQLLGGMERNEVARLDRALGRLAQVGRGPAHGSSRSSNEPDSRTSHEGLRRVTAVSTDSDVVDGALRLVVELAQISVSGADGVSVSLLRHGELLTVAATDDTIMEMDTEQYATGEGPCVDA